MSQVRLFATQEKSGNMSQESVIVTSLDNAPAFSDSDEDFDLTDTNLLASDDEELKSYIDIPSNKAESVQLDGDYIESLRLFSPLTIASIVKKEKNVVSDVVSDVVTTKYAPIELLSDSEDDLVEIQLKYPSSVPSDPPDYESRVEDENRDTKPTHFDSPDKEDSNNPAYDELLEMCGRDVGSMDDRMDDDDFDDHLDDDNDYDEDFHQTGSPKVKVKNHRKRISPYNVKNRNIPVQGKGKQLVSGAGRFKSTQKKLSSPVATDSNQDLVFSDSGRPICFGDGLIDLNSPVKEEEKPAAPPPPMLCESCEKEEGHNNMVQCCDGHIVCTRCVEASTKKVLVGEKKGSVECSHSDCSSSVPISELRKALPAIVLDLLEDKWNKETLEALENMKDSVKCPGCNYSAVLDMSMKRFQCVQCMEAYCRYCDRKWSDRKKHDLCIRTKQWTSTVTGNVVNIPAQWSDAETDAMEGKSEGHTLVELDTTSAEFYDVVHLMNKHMKSVVKKIFRIQNERLWEKYSLTRSHIVADLGELSINEKRLFHGTHADVIEAISKEGFDWRLCGKHGTVYGQGVVENMTQCTGKANYQFICEVSFDCMLCGKHDAVFGQGTYFAKSPVLSHRFSSGNLSSRGRNIPSGGTWFFGTLAKQPSQYKPALRFGAPINTTQASGFKFGAPSTTQITGFTLAASRPSQQSSSFGFGSPSAAYHQGFNIGTAPTASSSFTFGSSSSTSYPSTGYALTASTNNPNPVFRFGSTGGYQFPGSNASVGVLNASVTKREKVLPVRKQGGNDTQKINLPDPACLHSQQEQSAVSSTTGDNSLANVQMQRIQSHSNTGANLFVRAVPAQPPIQSHSNTGANLFVRAVPAQPPIQSHSNTGANLFVRAVPAQPPIQSHSNTGANLFVRAVPAQPPIQSHSNTGANLFVRAVPAQPPIQSHSNTGANLFVRAVPAQLPIQSHSNTGANLFVRAVPAQPSISGFSAGGKSSSGSVRSSGCFLFGTNGGNSNAGGSGSGGGFGFGGFGVDSNKSSDDYFMFLARVLVGHSCLGKHEMRRPSKDRDGRDTHSAVDREHKPSIFVIFDNNQCYPEYIIQYSTSSVI